MCVVIVASVYSVSGRESSFYHPFLLYYMRVLRSYLSLMRLLASFGRPLDVSKSYRSFVLLEWTLAWIQLPVYSWSRHSSKAILLQICWRSAITFEAVWQRRAKHLSQAILSPYVPNYSVAYLQPRSTYPRLFGTRTATNSACTTSKCSVANARICPPHYLLLFIHFVTLKQRILGEAKYDSLHRGSYAWPRTLIDLNN